MWKKYLKYFIFCLLVFQLFALPQSLKANVPIILTDELNQIGVRKDYVNLYEDKGGSRNIREVSSERWRDSFQVSAKKYPTNSNKSSTYWLQFRIVNKASREKRWLLEFFDHSINELTFYSPTGKNSFREFITGNNFPFSSKIFNHKNFEFYLDVAPGEEAIYYVKLKSKNDNVIVPEIRSYTRFVSYALQEYFMLGIFYGILAIMSVYNFLLYLSLKKKCVLVLCPICSFGSAIYTLRKWAQFPVYLASSSIAESILAGYFYIPHYAFLNSFHQKISPYKGKISCTK